MTTRDRSIVLGVAGIVLLAAFWFVALGPKRSEAKKLDANIASVQQRLQTAQSTVAAGTKAKASFPQDSATVTRLGKAVPADDDMASLLYQVQSSARGAKVAFGALERSGTDAAGGASAGAAAGGTGTTTQLPPGATVGTAGLATLPFSFTFTGSYFGLEHLLGAVHGYVNSSGDTIAVRGRLLTVEGVSLTAGDGDLAHIRAKVSATAYLAPSTGAAGASTATTPGQAAPAAGAAPTSSAITGGAS